MSRFVAEKPLSRHYGHRLFSLLRYCEGHGSGLWQSRFGGSQRFCHCEGHGSGPWQSLEAQPQYSPKPSLRACVSRRGNLRWSILVFPSLVIARPRRGRSNLFLRSLIHLGYQRLPRRLKCGLLAMTPSLVIARPRRGRSNLSLRSLIPLRTAFRYRRLLRRSKRRSSSQ